MHLQDLPEDVVRIIFSFTNVYAVVSISRTNTSFRALAVDRLVWVDLVENLRFRGFVDGESRLSISQKSQPELVDIVKHMVLGPKSWRLPKLSSVRKSLSKIGISQSSSKRTAPSKQYVLRPENINLSKQNDAHLLRGGEYVLFGNQTLECWNVVENRLVWEYEKPDQDWRVGRFSQDVLPGGNAANVILYLLKWLDDAWTENRVDIIYLDLRAGSSTTLLSSQYPTLNHSNLSDAGICGSLAFASLNCYDPGDGSFKTTVHTLFDLQTATPKLYLKLVSNVEFLVALTSEHIIFLVDPPNHDGPELRILSVAAVKSTGYWSDQLNTEHHDSIDIAQLPTVIVSKISLKHSASWRPPWRRELHVHQSPLDDGTYRVWVRWGGFRVDGTQAGTLAGYHLFVTGSSDETASAALRPRIESPVGNGVSYFGHALQQIRQNQYQVYVPGKTKPVALLELPGGAHFAYTSVYSGTIAYAERVIRVHYFD